MPVFLSSSRPNEDAQVEMGLPERVSPWVGSPFEWLMTLPSRSRGNGADRVGFS
jgi:hypothetical protein